MTGLRVAGCVLLDASCGMRTYGFQVAGCGFKRIDYFLLNISGCHL